MTESPDTFVEHPHPGDTTAAETRNFRRRFALGLMIAVSINIALLTGGAAVANYLTNVFHPFFFKTDKMVYVTLDVSPSPSPTPTPAQ